ncbi:MAG TPA: response regulator transcription factor [Hydrogenophaga sp.]|uniref:response regulator transcription factor n=1 Tax=Hydrogenophaga sp. TaxID=1904254 RepID=UPI002C0D4B74|nr:response regulator transcription factor [Hydrogenophaga sp.]HSX92288.1 response regulator transcription factor [Hydrogenophaga sp.]
MRLAALDDDVSQLDLIQRSVRAIGYECQLFERGQALLRELRRDSFDLLIVDWQLPDIAGPDVVRWVREHHEHAMPILFLTNRSEERDVVEGLGCGADDYMLKPIRVHELMARVKALIRRSYPQAEGSALCFGGYTIDLAARTVHYEGRPIELKHREFELARCLFSNTGRLLSRAYLGETVWGRAVEVPSRSLDTHISSLRAKLELRPARGFRLVAVYGQGYRLEAVDPSVAEEAS